MAAPRSTQTPVPRVGSLAGPRDAAFDKKLEKGVVDILALAYYQLNGNVSRVIPSHFFNFDSIYKLAPRHGVEVSGLVPIRHLF